jgi:hypothetical protein
MINIKDYAPKLTSIVDNKGKLPLRRRKNMMSEDENYNVEESSPDSIMPRVSLHKLPSEGNLLKILELD